MYQVCRGVGAHARGECIRGMRAGSSRQANGLGESQWSRKGLQVTGWGGAVTLTVSPEGVVGVTDEKCRKH